MAATYTEPSPNLRAPLLVRVIPCRSVTASFAEKSRRPSRDGVGEGARMFDGCKHYYWTSVRAQGPGRRFP